MDYLFPVLFSIAAMLTRKDLAIVVCAGNWLGLAVVLDYQGDGFSFHQAVLTLVTINLVIAIVAAHHFFIHKRMLSRVILIASGLTIFFTSLNIFGYFSMAYYATLAIQVVALFAMFFVDGQKEFVSDICRYSTSFVRYCGSNLLCKSDTESRK